MSIRTRLIFLIAIVVVPAILACAVTGYLVYRYQRSEGEKALLAAARSAAVSVDRETERLASNLKILARSPYLRAGDLEQFYTYAKGSLENEDLAIIVTLPSGQEVLNTLVPFGTKLPEHALAERIKIISETRETVLADLFKGTISGKPALALAVPVVDDDRVIYVIILGIFPNFFDRLLHSFQLPTSWLAAIVDRSGVLVARSQEPERFVGKRAVSLVAEAMSANREGLVTATTLEGLPSVTAFSTGPTFGWHFGVGLLQAELDKAVDATVMVVSLAGLLLVGIGLAVSLVVARGIASSIRSLARSATALERDGSFEVKPSGLAEVDAMAAVLADRERGLHEAIGRAERAAQTQSRFFAAASHDLRQPFQAMRLFFEVLVQSVTSDQQRIVDRLGKAMESAEDLLNTMLDVAQSEGGAIKFCPMDVDLGRLVGDLVTELHPVAVHKGLALRARVPSVAVRTDPLILKRILFNIVANAIKYTERGGVLIGLRRRRGQALVEVWDTGVGIAEDQAGHIFDEFYQVNNVARDRAKGIGLGLAIVKRLCLLAGCEVTLASRPGKGTVFRVVIPSEAFATGNRDDRSGAVSQVSGPNETAGLTG
jgi:signal transduction histidine kinase